MAKKENKPTKRQMEVQKGLDIFFHQDWENMEYNEDLLAITLRANEMYSKSIKKYLKTRAVIEFNTLKHIKEMCNTFSSREELNNFIVESIKTAKKKKELTYIEEIELATMIKFKEKVLQGKGKEYKIDKKMNFEFDYDQVKVPFEPFNLNDKEKEAKKQA
jgi:hypothetical protein